MSALHDDDDDDDGKEEIDEGAKSKIILPRKFIFPLRMISCFPLRHNVNHLMSRSRLYFI